MSKRKKLFLENEFFYLQLTNIFCKLDAVRYLSMPLDLITVKQN